MKRLRKTNELKLRYYAVGEYGTQTMRPHYHAILFNCEDKDKIQKAWSKKDKNGKRKNIGHIHVGNVTTDSIAYTLKYINKDGKIPQFYGDDRQKEFSLMSKNLGLNYLTPATIKFHRSRFDDLRVQKGEYKIAMPRYYREKIWTADERKKQLPLIIASVRNAEGIAEIDYDQNVAYPGIPFHQYQALEKSGRYKKFHRNKDKNRNKL